MRAPQTGEATTPRGKWTIDLRSTVQFAVACALVITLLALLRRGPGEAAEWPLVQGNIEDTRIVADHAVGRNGAESYRGRQNTSLIISLRVVNMQYGPTPASVSKAKPVFGWPCDNRGSLVG